MSQEIDYAILLQARQAADLLGTQLMQRLAGARQGGDELWLWCNSSW
jgi:hypothetical protein